MANKISLKAAARALGVPEHNLYERANEGRITVEERETGRVRKLVNLDTCHAEVEALRCQAPGCDKAAQRAGRFCSHACGARKYAPETRQCKNCGNDFHVEGHRTRDGDGEGQQFCDRKCVAEWRWKHEPETFPHSRRRGELKTCPICGAERYRPPSLTHLEHCSWGCAAKAIRRWHSSDEGHAHRAKLEAAQTAWWADVLRRADEQKGSALLVRDIAEQLGPMSVPTLTRYWPSRGLVRDTIEVDGRRFVIFPEPMQIEQLARLRARGFAWNTWLDPEWRVDHAPRPLIKETRVARERLRAGRRGPKPAPLYGSDRELESARAFIRHQRRLRDSYEAGRRAGRNPMEPRDWWAVEAAAAELIASGWQVGEESAQQLVWRAVQRLSKPLQIALT
jgi:hypothetical protein